MYKKCAGNVNRTRKGTSRSEHHDFSADSLEVTALATFSDGFTLLLSFGCFNAERGRCGQVLVFHGKACFVALYLYLRQQDAKVSRKRMTGHARRETLCSCELRNAVKWDDAE